MAGITIVGLGPGDPGDLTRQAWDVLCQSREIYLRTRLHPVVGALPETLTVHSFDVAYEAHDAFAEVYEAIAQQVIALGRADAGVVYAVPGDPAVGEATTWRIRQLAAEAGLPFRLLHGLSFLEPVCAAVGVDPLGDKGIQIHDAILVGARHFPPLDTDKPAVLGQCYSRELASEVKLTLLIAYPETHPVSIVQAATTGQARVDTVPLVELDRLARFDTLTALYIPPLPNPSSYESFQEIVAHLRAPEGCPWDREQTHLTLRQYLLEETYEVLDALDADDMPALQEELGDLLLQFALHVEIATEEGEFRLGDVIGTHLAKLIRRHPHVFGDTEVKGVEDILVNWEKIKRAEKAERAGPESEPPLGSVPQGMPALAAAQTYARRAQRKGISLSQPTIPALNAGTDSQEVAAGFGDALLALAAAAGQAGVDAESALREANLRLVARANETFHENFRD